MDYFAQGSPPTICTSPPREQRPTISPSFSPFFLFSVSPLFIYVYFSLFAVLSVFPGHGNPWKRENFISFSFQAPS